MESLTLHLLEPSHFHAALLLLQLDSRIQLPFQVHAAPHWDEKPFWGWIESLENRGWNLDRIQLNRSQDPVTSILESKGPSVALLAGQNQLKPDRILRLLLGNVPVICDKPLWVNVASGSSLSTYLETTNQNIFLDDCMTERFEPAFALQKLLLTERIPGFGLRNGNPNRIRFQLGNTHHLAKSVEGIPVKRSRAFFEVDTYGDPFADVGVHLVDHFLELLSSLGVSTQSLAKDPGNVESHWARLDQKSLRISTGNQAIPFPIEQVWQGGNGDSRGQISTQWLPNGENLPPEGQFAIVHGNGCSLVAAQDPKTQNMELDLVGLSATERPIGMATLSGIIEKLPAPWPKTNLEATRFGIRMSPPMVPFSIHSKRFPKVLTRFLDRIQQRRPLSWFECEKLRLKYALSAGAIRKAPNPQIPNNPIL